MTRKFRNSSVLLATLFFVAACSTGGGLGDILGGGGNSSNASLVRGTVDYVDTNSRSIVLTNVSGYQSMLSNSGSGNSLRVYFDERTSVQHEGQTYRPENLERGDEVDVRVMESGSQLVAESVTVVRDSTPGYDNGGTGSGTGGLYGSSLRGTVRYIDTSRRTIELDRGYGNTVIVEYDDRTPVAFNNRTYYPADLERGDEIDIRVTELGNNRFRAQDISVVRSVNNSGSIGSSSNNNLSVVRGTVRYVDTSRRTIELEQTTGVSGFNTGGGLITVSYGSNASIEVNGRGYPITGLERGDVIEVEVNRSSSSSNWFANRIVLVRDVNSR